MDWKSESVFLHHVTLIVVISWTRQLLNPNLSRNKISLSTCVIWIHFLFTIVVMNVWWLMSLEDVSLYLLAINVPRNRGLLILSSAVSRLVWHFLCTTCNIFQIRIHSFILPAVFTVSAMWNPSALWEFLWIEFRTNFFYKLIIKAKIRLHVFYLVAVSFRKYTHLI